jgi:hypothetical protein
MRGRLTLQHDKGDRICTILQPLFPLLEVRLLVVLFVEIDVMMGVLFALYDSRLSLLSIAVGIVVIGYILKTRSKVSFPLDCRFNIWTGCSNSTL